MEQSTAVHTLDSILAMEKRYRAAFINSLLGPKPGNLVGTQNRRHQANLAIMSSAFHLGASPPLVGLIIRPDVSPRHTLQNILDTGYYTLNQLNASIVVPGHQTSARYPEEVSEFEATGLTTEQIRQFPAPFVRESLIKIGLKLLEHHPIKINGTHLIIGEVQLVSVPQQAIGDDGHIDLVSADAVGITGLDSYHRLEQLQRLSYAKVDKDPEPI